MLQARGFTLLELMITIVIATILMLLAVPGMRSFLLASSRGEASTSLYGGLVLARAEAITRNAQVSICQRDFSGGNAFPRCGSSGWTRGWIVYRDSNPTDIGAKPFAAGDVIGVGEPTDASFVFTTVPAGVGSLQFDAAGRAMSSAVEFDLCKTGDVTFEGRKILVELNGRVALTRFKFASCPAA
ncbi:MAG: hypothetical protein NVS9B10_03090 [Nevskia sp.]